MEVNKAVDYSLISASYSVPLQLAAGHLLLQMETKQWHLYHLILQNMYLY